MGSWWIGIGRDRFTARGLEMTGKAPLEPAVENLLAEIEAHLEEELKEGWIADPEGVDDE